MGKNSIIHITTATNAIIIYLITQVILAFWLVLACDLLEDRYTIDVIITKCLCFKMAEISENLYNILCDWAKEKIQKSLVDAFTGTKSKKKKKAVSFSGNASNISL